MQSSGQWQQRETVLDSIGLRLTSHRWGRCQMVNVCGRVGAGTAGLLHTGLDRTLLVFPTFADFGAWNGDPGTQPDARGDLICG
jgi:hypothetical protein